MAWTPIADAGYAFTFNGNGFVQLDGSTVTTNGNAYDVTWTLTFDDDAIRPLRITAQSYEAGGDAPASFGFPPSIEVIENETPPDSFTPSPLEASGSGVEYYPGSEFETPNFDTYAFLIEVETPDPEPVAACEELGRVSRAYVSGYQRARTHRSRLVRGERRCLTADFNGAIPKSRTITSVTWRCDIPQCVYMRDAAIVSGGREVRVDITAQLGAEARVKCEVTLDNGEVYNQVFVIYVRNAPWFMGESAPQATGPYVLTVTA